MTDVVVELRIPAKVDAFLRDRFAPHQIDVDAEYEIIFLRGLEKYLREEFTDELTADLWDALRNFGIKIPVTVEMSKALEVAADQGITVDQLVQKIISEKLGNPIYETNFDENTKIRVWKTGKEPK